MALFLPKGVIPKSSIDLLMNSDDPLDCVFAAWLIKHDPRSVALIVKALYDHRGLPMNKDDSGAPAEAIRLLGITDFEKGKAYDFFQAEYSNYIKK